MLLKDEVDLMKWCVKINIKLRNTIFLTFWGDQIRQKTKEMPAEKENFGHHVTVYKTTYIFKTINFIYMLFVLHMDY
jgi:hypothetical protein